MRRLVSRAHVIATAIAALVAVLVARDVLSSGSGTYFAVQVTAALIVVPGGLVWWQPRLRWYVVWAVIAFLASAGLIGFGDPYAYERELGGWGRVDVASWAAMSIAVLGALVGVFYLGAGAGSASEPLARRLRRIVHLVVLLAVVAAAFSWLPAERVFVGKTFLHVRTSGGARFVVLLTLMLLPALLVYRDPRKHWAWLWWAWTVPSAVVVLLMVFGFHILSHGEPLWPRAVVGFCVSMILVLVLVGVPIVAIVTRTDPRSPLPDAHVRET
jgi:hypothetical protein